jgi:hypothetical protein
MSDEDEPIHFRHADAATGKAAYRTALETLDLTPQELLLGKVDEDDDILWSGCPRSLFEHPRTWPTVDWIIEEVFGAERPANDHEKRDQ